MQEQIAGRVTRRINNDNGKYGDPSPFDFAQGQDDSRKKIGWNTTVSRK
jgi:hypothetical protein